MLDILYEFATECSRVWGRMECIRALCVQSIVEIEVYDVIRLPGKQKKQFNNTFGMNHTTVCGSNNFNFNSLQSKLYGLWYGPMAGCCHSLHLHSSHSITLCPHCGVRFALAKPQANLYFICEKNKDRRRRRRGLAYHFFHCRVVICEIFAKW